MRNLKQTSHTWLAAIAALGLSSGATKAQTVIPGPTIPTSTWSPSGSPYIIAGDCTLASGNTLTILPGTAVWIGQGLSLTCNGRIEAVGTPTQRITFQAPVSSQTWNTIIVNNTTGTNQFKYCDFSNATNALDFRGASINQVSYCSFSNATKAVIYRDNSTNTTLLCCFNNLACGIWMTIPGRVGSVGVTQESTILNCAFSNVISQSIYGEAIGSAGGMWSAPETINTVVKNCYFSAAASGCQFQLQGTQVYYAGVYWTGYGYGTLHMENNVFRNVTNSAIRLSVGNYAGGGPATLINNTIVNAGSAVIVQDPWDANVQSCLFVNCTNAVKRSGSLSATVRCNDFSANGVNFTGYPSTYGQPILANRNGTPCDLLFNIFQDPLFVSATDFRLQGTSPCIDAGEGSPANFDTCLPPSLGSVTNDIGAYGGPGACGWPPEQGNQPELTTQPASQSSCLGHGAVFSVTAIGSPPLKYQWYHGTTLLDGQTNATLTLTNLQAAHAGVYQVEVLNDYGSTNSLPVALTVNDACVDLKMYAGLNIAGQAGQTYVLKYTTDLAETNFANWTPLATNTMGSSDWFYLDLESPFSPRRFYGVKKQ